MAENPDPEAARVVQELLGGRYGEMSTLMNYTYQSFNFRQKDKLKPYYDLVANIATEELGHIEVVAATINGLLPSAAASFTSAPPATRTLTVSIDPSRDANRSAVNPPIGSRPSAFETSKYKPLRRTGRITFDCEFTPAP